MHVNRPCVNYDVSSHKLRSLFQSAKKSRKRERFAVTLTKQYYHGWYDQQGQGLHFWVLSVLKNHYTNSRCCFYIKAIIFQ